MSNIKISKEGLTSLNYGITSTAFKSILDAHTKWIDAEIMKAIGWYNIIELEYEN